MLESPWQVPPPVLPEGKRLCVLHEREDVLREAQVPAEAKALDVLSVPEARMVQLAKLSQADSVDS